MRTRASQRGYHDDFPWWKYNPLDVQCPECDAEIGKPCWSKDRRFQRVRKHMVRWQEAARQAGD